MFPGGPTEAIRLFAGHMHVYDVVLYTGDVYLDPAYPGVVGHDHDPWVPAKTQFSPFDLETFGSLHISLPPAADAPLIKAHVSHHFSPPPGHFYLQLPVVHAELPQPLSLPQPLLGSGQPQLDTPAPTSEMVNAGQINHLVSTDYVAVDPNSAAVQAATASEPHDVGALLDIAQQLTPAALNTISTNGNILITQSADAVALINTHDATMASEPAGHPTVAPGEYVNGHFDANYGTPFPEITVPDQPAAPINIQGQLTPALDLTAGSNSQVNAATIVDLNPHTTMMVLGDSYQTNAIFQVNILHDVDKISLSAPQNLTAQDLVHLQTGNDSLNNYASFHNYTFPDLTITGMPASSWHVDIEQGNFYNVNVVAQTNVMVDGDVTYQTTHSSYYQLVTGANQQYNGAFVDSQGDPYDLVIVMGNSHHANIIDQTNVVLNDDVVHALLSADNATSMSISTGNNSLTNEADISNYGPSAFSTLSADLAAHAANAQGGGFDPLVAGQVPNNGHLNVLVVTGDYYDINIVSQINVLADSNTAMQILAQATGNSSTETISTGSNQAANLAQIVNAHTFGTEFVGGGQYSDSLLLQANILTDQSTVDTVNPNALVNEVVAFLDHDAAAAIPSNIAIPSTDTSPHHDGLGSMMS